MLLRSVSLLALASFALAAHASVAYNNFGAGNGGLAYDSDNGNAITTSSSFFGTTNYVAMPFTSATTGNVSLLSIGVYRLRGSGRVQVGVYADNGSNDVGALLGSTAVVTVTGATGAQPVSTARPSGAALVAGGKYWVGLIGLDDTAASWGYTSPLTFVRVAPNFEARDGTVLTGRSAFRVETQPVPEPASVAALGLGGLAALRRRKPA